MQLLLRARIVRRSIQIATLLFTFCLFLIPGALWAQDDLLRPAQSDPAWQGEYFANATLSGTPALTAQMRRSIFNGAAPHLPQIFPMTAFRCAGRATSTSPTMASTVSAWRATMAHACLSTTKW